jgi:hypothetical protein
MTKKLNLKLVVAVLAISAPSAAFAAPPPAYTPKHGEPCHPSFFEQVKTTKLGKSAARGSIADLTGKSKTTRRCIPGAL